MRQQVFLGQVSAAGLLLTVSGLFYSRVFGGAGWIGPVIGGLLLSAVLGVVLARTSMHRIFRVLALTLFGALFLLLAVILPSTNFGGAGDVASAFWDASVDGWRNSLAATLPIDTSLAAPLGFVTLLAWATGSIVGTAIVRSDEPTLPVVPCVVFAALSLPLAAPNGLAAYAFIAALIGSALLLTLVRAVPEALLNSDDRDRVTEFVGERMLTERLISGVPILLVLGLLAPLLAFVLPGGPEEPFDPRRLRVEEVETISAVNPLAIIKARREAADPTEQSFILDLPAPPSADDFDRIGLVPLEIFNGANWTTTSTTSATSSDLPVLLEPSVETIDVRQIIEFPEADLPWVPAGNNPIRVEGDDIWFDDVSGALAPEGGARAIRYEVVSRVPFPTADQLVAAQLDLSDSRYLELPTIPADSALNLLGDQLGTGQPYERLQALEAYLQDDDLWTWALSEPSGTSIGRLDNFFQEQQGYRDQFVSAFAVAARQRGFPTRIMVGYRITEEAQDGSNQYLETITSAQYDAWPEVRFEGIGWVAFDPVPSVEGAANDGGEDPSQIPEGREIGRGQSPNQADPDEADPDELDDNNSATTVRVLVVSGLFLLLFPLMLLVIVFFIKFLRRRWRENLDNPTDRILAGWQESKDRLLEAGVDIRPDMTVKEIVAASRKDLGVHASSSLSALAPHVTTTIYAPSAPTSETADMVWEEVDLFDRQLSESRTRRQNLKAKVDPRPLLEGV
jgi:transglutaminase-like putative cysteine protease